MEMVGLIKVFLALLGFLSVVQARNHRTAFVPKHNHLKNDTSYRNKDENEVLLGAVEPGVMENVGYDGEEEEEEGWDDTLPILQQKPEPTEEILATLRVMAEEIAGLRGQLSTLKFQNHLIYKQLKKTPYKCSMPVPPPIIQSAAMRLEEPRPKTCPPEFIENKETRSCYKFGTDRITWRMAREKCRAQDADLVSINTRREQKYLAQTARENPSTRHCDFWAGATDLGSEGKWYWVANKRPLSYSNWNHDEPNNGNGDEHCMHMLWVFNWAWNDARCNYDNACYICESKLN